VPHYDLDDLLSALNEVAADSAPDDDSRDANDDPDDDDSRDPNDDYWNREQGEDGEQDDGTDDDEGDYTSRRAVMLLEKLRSEPVRWTLNPHIARRIAQVKQPEKPVTKANQNWRKIEDLRQKTSQIHYEIKTDKLLADEVKKYKEASVALYLANLTPAEKAEHEADMRRMAHYYSGICKEASYSWREDAAAEFGSRYRQ
jgi:hypothetical protein